MVLSGRLDVETGNDKFKMAAVKPEVYLYLSFYTRQQINSNGYPMFSGSGNLMALSERLRLEAGSGKFKMVAAKPDVTCYTRY